MFEADSIEEITATEKQAFTIDTEDKANWLLSKLAGIRAEQERVKAQAEKRIAELTADYEGLMFRFGAELEAFARQESERRRRRTVTLLQGTLAFRTVPASLKVAELTDALTTAKAVCPDAIQTVEELDRKAFLIHATAHFEETGELLPGVDRTPEHESFTVKFPSAGKE